MSLIYHKPRCPSASWSPGGQISKRNLAPVPVPVPLPSWPTSVPLSSTLRLPPSIPLSAYHSPSSLSVPSPPAPRPRPLTQPPPPYPHPREASQVRLHAVAYQISYRNIRGWRKNTLARRVGWSGGLWEGEEGVAGKGREESEGKKGGEVEERGGGEGISWWKGGRDVELEEAGGGGRGGGWEACLFVA